MTSLLTPTQQQFMQSFSVVIEPAFANDEINTIDQTLSVKRIAQSIAESMDRPTLNGAIAFMERIVNCLYDELEPDYYSDEYQPY